MTKIIFEIISLAGTAFATITAGIVAILGFNAWRREFIGKRKIELAEDILTNFYEARDAIGYIRSIFGSEGEGSSRKPRENETEREAQILNEAHVKWERYQENKEPFVKLQALKYRFMAQNGRDSIEPIIEIVNIVNEILMSARMISEYRKMVESGQTHLSVDKIQKIINDNEVVFWDMGESSKEFNDRIESAVIRVEGICNSIINEKSS